MECVLHVRKKKINLPLEKTANNYLLLLLERLGGLGESSFTLNNRLKTGKQVNKIPMSNEQLSRLNTRAAVTPEILNAQLTQFLRLGENSYSILEPSEKLCHVLDPILFPFKLKEHVQ